MNASVKHRCFAAAAIASSGLIAGPVSAQSLALSYGLEVESARTVQLVTPVDRCIGRGHAFIASACSSPGWKLPTNATVADTLPVRASVPAANAAAKDVATDGDSRDTESPSPELTVTPLYELPLLGSAEADARLPRLEGSKDLTGNLKTVDVNFRLGSRYRLTSADDGWGPYKFTDVAYESRVQNNMKALGLELLFPFQ
jgi:hypothetical protein